MRSTAFQQRVKLALDELDPYLPVPWSIDVLVSRLAGARGRPIHLVPWLFPVENGQDRQSGLWIPTRIADYVFFDKLAFPVRREQIIGHELGHLLLGHIPKLTSAPDELLAALAPSIGPEVARRILSLARAGYGAKEEALAEQFGTNLSRRGIINDTDGVGDELGRLTDSLR